MVGKKGLGPRPGGNKVAVGMGGVFCRQPVLAVVNAAPSNKTLLPFPMQLVDPRLTNQVGWGGGVAFCTVPSTVLPQPCARRSTSWRP